MSERRANFMSSRSWADEPPPEEEETRAGQGTAAGRRARVAVRALVIAAALGAVGWVGRAAWKAWGEEEETSAVFPAGDAEGDWRALAAAEDGARLQAFHALFSRRALYLSSGEDPLPRLVHAVAGLDPDGSVSRRALERTVLPALDPGVEEWLFSHALRAALLLRPDPDTTRRIAACLVERMRVERDGFLLSSLALTMADPARRIGAPELREGARALTARLRGARSSAAAVEFGRALGALSGRVEPAEAREAAAALSARMETEMNSLELIRLGEALASLSGKLEAAELRTAAAALTLRLRMEPDGGVLVALAETLARLGGKGSAGWGKEAETVLAARMKTETRGGMPAELERALAALTGAGARTGAASLFTTPAEHPAVNGAGSAHEEARAPAESAAAPAALEALTARLRAETAADELARLARDFTAAEPAASAGAELPARARLYVDLLHLPLVTGDARAALLDGLGKAVGRNFNGNLWDFIDWATKSEEGRALQLELPRRGAQAPEAH